MRNDLNIDYMEPRTIYIQHKKKSGAGKVLGTILLLAGLGYAGYKAYEKFGNKEEEAPEFDVEETVTFDAEAAAEESLADKIKAAAKKVIKK